MYKVFGVIADGIEQVLSEDGKVKTEIYDLSGRRIPSPNKGGVYIVNGKKVVLPATK
jgi:hypothetical protein